MPLCASRRRKEGFQPTLPARGATHIASAILQGRAFQPTLPARGATAPPNPQRSGEDISTHAPRTGSDGGCTLYYNQDIAISTHAPRTGSDMKVFLAATKVLHFNPRSPHGERLDIDSVVGYEKVFQPTLPARGATLAVMAMVQVLMNFNPRSPHGERPRGRVRALPHFRISTHAPRTGSDPCPRCRWGHPCHFNPRSPHGERPDPNNYKQNTEKISTHAPRTGSDKYHTRGASPSPHISTHAPRTGSDHAQTAVRRDFTNFNPRSPHGERR